MNLCFPRILYPGATGTPGIRWINSDLDSGQFKDLMVFKKGSIRLRQVRVKTRRPVQQGRQIKGHRQDKSIENCQGSENKQRSEHTGAGETH